MQTTNAQAKQPNKYTQKAWLAALLLSLTFSAGCATVHNPSNAGMSPTGQTNSTPPATPNVIQATPTWFACKTDTDCVITEGVCAADQAVNSDYLKPFSNYRASMDQSVECSSKAQEETKHTAQCVQHRCSLNPPNHQP